MRRARRLKASCVIGVHLDGILDSLAPSTCEQVPLGSTPSFERIALQEVQYCEHPIEKESSKITRVAYAVRHFNDYLHQY